MPDKFASIIQEKGLFNPDDKVLIAVSGGKDSVAMAHLFHRAGYSFIIAHCNFQLRSNESDQDELFVKDLASNLGVNFYSVRFDTKEYAVSQGVSIQMAARQLRYKWFEEMRIQTACEYIATAHHMDDQTETVLANIIRGAGLPGLRGIWPKRNKIIRPLWYLNRQEIDQFIEEHSIQFREDSSNSETKYTRNHIRHKILPMINQINPSFNDSITRLSRIATDTDELLNYFINKEIQPERKGEKVFIEIQKILSFPSQEIILFELLKEYGFLPEIVSDIVRSLAGQAGKLFYSSTHVGLIDRQHLIVSPIKQTDRNAVIWIDENEQLVKTPDGLFHFTICDKSEVQDYKTTPNEIFVEKEKLVFPLLLRHPVDGDFFYPFGMSGKKKVSDYLTEMKIPRTDKPNVWLLSSGDMIIWIAGMRSDERFRISQAGGEVLKVTFAAVKNDCLSLQA
jgi:tRNA(Ile)-lysidine synthase